MTYILWGRKPSDPAWNEVLITEQTDINKINQAKAWAKENGYITRLATLNMSDHKIDFTKAINH